MKNIQSIVPLLPAQQFMLTASLKKSSDIYVQQLVFKINKYSWQEINEAIKKLVDSYQLLRSIILYEGLKQAVWVCSETTYPSILKHRCDIENFNEFYKTFRKQGFSFDKEPCIRFDWVEVENDFYLCITNHHILFDGWGKQKLLHNFIKTLKNPNFYLPKKLNKNWYEGWNNFDHNLAISKYKSYLLDFKNFSEINFFPGNNFKNNELKKTVNSSNLELISKEFGMTVSEVLNFCWSCFIVLWTNNPRVQFGVVKQTGLINKVKNGFGLGIQTLPHQFYVDINKPINELALAYKNREREIAEFSFVNTLDAIFSKLNYSFLIAFENYPLEKSLNDVEDEFKLFHSYDYSEFPLSLAVTPNLNDYQFDWHFNEKFHAVNQIEHIANSFENFILDFKFNKLKTLKSISINNITTEFKNFKSKVDTNTFFLKIENHLNIDQKVTYNHLLKQLININRIWIYGDKHIDLQILICAAWKSGVEVVTVNEKETKLFIEELLIIKHPDIVFYTNDFNFDAFNVSLKEIQSFELKKEIKSKLSNQGNVSLSLSTSGSTGKPKVVQLSLENLINFFVAWDEKLPWRKKEVFAIIAHPAFDIGVAELIFPLFKGYESKIIQKEDLIDPKRMNRLFCNVTAFHMVPALLKEWISMKEPDDLQRIIMTGGDRVTPFIFKNINKKFNHFKLFQFYGPSECSVLTTGFRNKGQFNDDLLPIGTSFSNCEVLIFNNDSTLAPPFQIGEIVIIGDSVGMGYANEDNKNNFFNYNGNSAYRTGDLGTIDLQGNIFFKGRLDKQIKINGQRLEIQRIESALRQWSKLENWVVIVKDKIICAFGKLNDSTNLPSKKTLYKLLPIYAVPQLIEVLDEFPLNKNNKVDIRKLEIIADEKFNSKNLKVDNKLEEIMNEIFPKNKINYKLGWYANNLNSVDALKLAGKIKSNFNLSISIEKILTSYSISEIPQYYDKLIKQTNEIKVGNIVHESAQRIFFLSESDENLNKIYWIINGFVLDSTNNFISRIKDWILFQKSFHLKITPSGNSYLWKESDFSIKTLDVNNVREFTDLIQNHVSSIFRSLFEVFVGESGSKTFIAFKIHHGLLDGIGAQQFFETMFENIKMNKFQKIIFREPYYENADNDFWSNYLKEVKVQNLPFQRIQKKSYNNSIRFELEKKQLIKIKDLKKQFNCGTFEALLILWSSLWLKYFPKGDFSTGITINSRKNLEAGIIEGMSSNTLPFLIETADGNDVIDKWRHLFEKRFERFSEIASLDNSNNKDGTPFFNTTIVYNKVSSEIKDVEELNFDIQGSTSEISLDVIDDDDDIYFQWEFNNTKFSDVAIEKIHYSLFDNKDISKKELKKDQLQEEIIDIWSKVIKKFPNNDSIVCGDVKLNYFELNQKIKNLKSKIKYKGSGIIPLVLGRSMNDVILVITCIVHNIPFIPIDNETPESRIKQIEKKCKQHRLTINDDLKNFIINTNPSFNNDLMYAIATSGSTGEPKLVGVSRFNYESAIQSWKYHYNLSPNDTILQAASFSFDVFLGDIGRSIFNGATLNVLDAFQRKDPDYIKTTLSKLKSAVFETTPLIVRWWLQDELSCFNNLKLLIVGSDSWKVGEMKTLKSLLPNKVILFNSYGLSETTIDNSFCSKIEDYPDELTVPIGKPMNNSNIAITDISGEILPEGKQGYITISGPCLGKGYYDGESWNIFNKSWRSADRGVVDEFGNMHFLGRSDKQVKIRGQRLELVEVETVLSNLDKSIDWVVFTYETNFSKELAVAYTNNLSKEQIQKIRSKLLSSYPSYFLPSLFLHTESFKMNLNGKIDYDHLINKALNSNNEKEVISSDIINLDNPFIELMKKLFGRTVNEKDNFFSLGYSSFDAMLFVREWNQNNSKKLKVFQVFSCINFYELFKVLETEFESKDIISNNWRLANKSQEAIWIEIQYKDSSLYNLPHFIELPRSHTNMLGVLSTTLKYCKSIFSKFELDSNNKLVQIFLDSTSFKLDKIFLSVNDFKNFKKSAYYKKINLTNGPCFEAALIDVEGDLYFYFNPHHLVYDGGSDAALQEIFNSVLKEEKPVLQTNLFEENISINSWDLYFNSCSLPVNLIKNNVVKNAKPVCGKLNSQELRNLNKLQINWKTSQATVYSLLLGDALQKNNFPIEWISLVMDTRDVPEIGMFMRAFPIPVNNQLSISKKIGLTKSALTFLFKNKNNSIIYPQNTDYNSFHQVGLVIQHPFSSPNVNFSPDDYSRPRLPLTLYVDNVNQDIYLRWEYDICFFEESQIRAIETSFKESIVDYLNFIDPIETFSLEKNIEIDNYDNSIEKNLLNHPWITIWEKYVPNSNNNFFRGGGTSIQSMLMINELNSEFEKNISLHEFLQKPNFSDLISFNLKTIKPKDITLVLNHGDLPECWYIPPIMGLGLIFNNYPYDLKTKAIAFNYPAAINSVVNCESIENLAEILVDSYLENYGFLPENIANISAYSMGGIVAFEMIKILNRKGVKIKSLKIWDKSAQLKKSNSKQKIKKISSELMNYVNQIVTSDNQRTQMMNYLLHHQNLIHDYLQKGTIHCELSIYYCSNNFNKDEIFDWEKINLGATKFIELKNINHYDIPDYWNKLKI